MANDKLNKHKNNVKDEKKQMKNKETKCSDRGKFKEYLEIEFIYCTFLLVVIVYVCLQFLLVVIVYVRL